MTARHCVVDRHYSDLTVVLAEHNRHTSDGEEEIDVVRITKHESYDGAILKLACQPTKDTIEVISMSGSDPDVGADVIVAGWGWTRPGTSSVATILQTINIPVASRGDCALDGLGLGAHEFCGGSGTVTYNNVCHGDSGSPIFIKNLYNEYKLIGLVERGVAYCPATANYAVFLRASFIRRWISTSTRTNVGSCYVEKEKEEDSSCFPGGSLVRIESTKSEVPLRTLVHGDRVLTMSSEGKPVYSEFLGHLHFDSSKVTEYLEIESSDNMIRVSDNHLIYVSVDGQSRFDYARKIKIGHYILTVNENGVFDQSIVKSISRINAVSLYAPLTSEGTIIVDGVVASCYANVPHTIGHIGMWPYRMWRQYISNSDPTEEMSTYVKLNKDYVMPIIHLFT